MSRIDAKIGINCEKFTKSSEQFYSSPEPLLLSWKKKIWLRGIFDFNLTTFLCTVYLTTTVRSQPFLKSPLKHPAVYSPQLNRYSSSDCSKNNILSYQRSTVSLKIETIIKFHALFNKYFIFQT